MYFGNRSAFGHGFDFCVIAIVVVFDSELWLAFGSVLCCVDLFARGCRHALSGPLAARTSRLRFIAFGGIKRNMFVAYMCLYLFVYICDTCM